MSKASMKTILPRYNGIRMCMDYLREFYAPAIRHYEALSRGAGTGANDLAAWKKRVAAAWTGVCLRFASEPPAAIRAGDPLLVEVAVRLNGLDASDVVVECLAGRKDDVDCFVPVSSINLEPKGREAEDETIFAADLRGCSDLPLEGLRQFRIRIYPFHPLLAHRFECGCMLWL
jgi:starch phosphorylase